LCSPNEISDRLTPSPKLAARLLSPKMM
jgi:hypothetical protein